MFGLLVVVTAAAHLSFVAYVVFGGFLAFRWPRTIWLQVPIVCYGVAIELLDFTCPLTTLEIWARERAGMAPMHRGGFVDHYISGPLLGNPDTGTELVALVVCVLASWVTFAIVTVRRRSGQSAHHVAR